MSNVTTPGLLTFEAQLTAATGNATGIAVPEEIVDALGQGKRPAVVVHLGAYKFRTTLGTMSGQRMIPVSAAHRAAAGVAAGDVVEVGITADTAPREVVVPKDFAAALAAQPAAGEFFAGLSNSLQRYHIGNIEGAKAADTRARRVDKAIELFLAKKPR